jgi:hypothetical protein
MHQSYEEKLKRREDFRVKYRFYTSDEGGRKTLPYQGYRSDFWYPHKEHKIDNIFMIWPEFEDEDGNIILDNEKPVGALGYTKMWIVNQTPYKKYHRGKIKVGTKGYFMEGPTRVAECEVIELVGLLTG